MPGIPFVNLPAAQMMDEQYSMEQRQVTQWFDSMRVSLEQQELEPEQHMKQYAALMKQAQTQSMQIYNQHQANALFLKQLDELVEDGSLMDYQARKIGFRMAGVQDPQALKQMSGEPEEIDWTKQYHANVRVQKELGGFLEMYKVEKGGLYEVDSKGEIIDKKRPEGPDVIQHYNMASNMLDYYKRQERDIYKQMWPMEQAALEMERVTMDRTRKQRPTDGLFQYLGTAGVPGTIGVGAIKAFGKSGAGPKELFLGPDLPRPTTRAEYERLPSVTRYIHPDRGIQTKR